MKQYNKPKIELIIINIENNIADSLSNRLNPNFIEDTDVVVDFSEFI